MSHILALFALLFSFAYVFVLIERSSSLSLSSIVKMCSRRSSDSAVESSHGEQDAFYIESFLDLFFIIDECVSGKLPTLSQKAALNEVLDNFANIQASWVTQGPKIAQLSLFFGANDFGSTMIEENVVAAAGISFRLSEEEIRRLVSDAGFTPRQRRMDYALV